MARRFGVALSGGGFRAALFGLGVLLYLVDSGSHRQVVAMSSVSGGAYTSARTELACNFRHIDPVDYRRRVGPLIGGIVGRRMWVNLTVGPFVLLVVAAVGALVWTLGRSGSGRWLSLPVAFALSGLLRLRGRVLGGRVERSLLGDLGDHRPRPGGSERLVIDHVYCATNLHDGELVYLGDDFLYTPYLGWASELMPLRRRVRASAAIPIVFPPSRIPTARFERPIPGDVPKRIRVCDGGLTDNLGEQWLRDLRLVDPEDKYRRGVEDPDHLVVVNASKPFGWRRRGASTPLVGSIARVLRYGQILLANSVEQRLDRLRDEFRQVAYQPAAPPSGGPAVIPGTVIGLDTSPYLVPMAVLRDQRATPEQRARAKAVLRRLRAMGEDWSVLMAANQHVPTIPRRLKVATAGRLLLHGYVLAWSHLHTLFDTGTPTNLPSLASMEAWAKREAVAPHGPVVTPDRQAPPVVVVGGGLAGMAAAWRLARAGRAVTLFEASDRLGGKASSIDVAGGPGGRYLSDHGYHVFPSWYDHVRRLMGEVGVDLGRAMKESRRFRQLRRQPEVLAWRGDGAPPPGRGGRIQPLTSEPVGWAERFAQAQAGALFLHGALVLATSSNRRLARQSLQGFLERRWYMSARAIDAQQGLVLKALSNDVSSISALSVARMYRRWSAPPQLVVRPAWSALRGSLTDRFIRPLEEALGDLGVQILRHRELVEIELDSERQRVAALQIRDNTGEIVRYRLAGEVVLAIPPDRYGAVLGPRPDRAFGSLLEVPSFRTEVMSGADIHFSEQILWPVEHFSIPSSRYAITGYDITRNWARDDLPRLRRRRGGGTPPSPTILQVVVGDTRPLRKDLERLDGEDRDARYLQLIVDDVVRVHPELRDAVDVKASVLHVNENAPLFMNDVGTHPRRPPVNHEQLGNLYVAGDFCRSTIDVASMEAAVATGEAAAEAVQGGPDSPPEDHAAWRRWKWLWWALRWSVGLLLLAWNGVVKLYEFGFERLRVPAERRPPRFGPREHRTGFEQRHSKRVRARS